MSPEWVMVGVEAAGVAIVIWQVWNGHKKTMMSVVSTISTSQEVSRAVGKVRDEQHAKDMKDIKDRLDRIETGEKDCRLGFEHRITEIAGQAKSTQVELTELKVELKEGM